MTEWTGNGADWARNAPVFATNNEFEWGGRTWSYPDVWVTEQRCEPTAERTGRMCVGHYTPDTDPDGDDALYYGGGYYDGFLSRFEGVSVGLCRSSLRVESLAGMGCLEPHDVPVDLVVEA